mmetsp:Transcript_6452/g.12466  ORF Transcript_6452/g.12466 Transcript_6452/m.12466 type:complete len:192 (+) Transcript_6452:258-833(+)
MWIMCTTLGHDRTALLTRFQSTTGAMLATMDAAQLTNNNNDNDSGMGFSHEQAKHILERIAFTKHVTSLEQAAVEMEKLRAEKKALQENLAALQHVEELVDEIDKLKAEKQAIQDEITAHKHVDEMAAEMNKMKLEKQAVLQELEALQEQLQHHQAENVVAIQSSAQLRQDEPHVGKRHYKEDAYQKNRYF